jgi:RimJ/RimL family protein N-acetyltransferase
MAKSTPPVLETARLTLRGHSLEDLDDCAAMWGDPVVAKHIGGRAFSREETWRKILGYAGHWSLMEFGYWVVQEKASGRFVGEVGFAEFKRDLQPSIEGTPEAGWVLSPWAHGKGFATESVRAALVWLGKPTVCLIDPANVASLGVAGKCGYAEYARSLYHGGAVILLRRDREAP